MALTCSRNETSQVRNLGSQESGRSEGEAVADDDPASSSHVACTVASLELQYKPSTVDNLVCISRWRSNESQAHK